MRALVSTLARGLVRRPDRVHVDEWTEHERVIIELTVHPDDRGRVIGREGRTARALRTLLGAVAREHDRACSLEIVD